MRTLSYNRAAVDEDLDERIERTEYNRLGFASSRIDARLLSADETPNFAYVTSVAGGALCTVSVDAGTSWALADIDGRPVWTHDARGTTATWTYDVLGRPLTAEEAVAGQAPATREVWVYGEREADAQAHNLRGQCVRRYDTAGQVRTLGYTLGGQPQDETRRLLAELVALACWPGDDEAGWDTQLSTQAWTTGWDYDALGSVIAQTDAKGHRRRWSMDVAGQLQVGWLKLAGAVHEQVLVSGIRYTAAGELLAQTAGNGVATTCEYEAETRRLVHRRTHRADGTLVQALGYAYDPVGNILGISDAAQEVRYFRNQRVAAQATYRHDALYQLLEATGRENATAGGQGPVSPPGSDSANLVNYMRRYTYDRGGNLTRIEHQGGSAWRNDIVVSDRSNHGVAQADEESLRPGDIDNGSYFDACGNRLALKPGQAQVWNVRNQLEKVTLIDRGGDSDNDRETYGYDGSGMRVWKQTRARTASTWRTQQVIYLPGLELRTTEADGKTEEALDVVMVPDGSMRVLHWTAGRPEQIPNDQYRWSVRDQIASAILELDGDGRIITQEEYYPYGGTAVWGGNEYEVKYKFIRYSGKERDATGLYYYGYRYYMPWLGRWASADPAFTIDGLNLYRMARNCPINYYDPTGLDPIAGFKLRAGKQKEIPGSILSSVQPDLSGRTQTVELTLPEQYKIWPMSAVAGGRKLLPIVSDLLNAAPGQQLRLPGDVLQHGGIARFSFLGVNPGGQENYMAIAPHVELFGAEVTTGSTVKAYWVPQGKYYDIPVHPDITTDPIHVFTPAFSGCSFVVDMMSEETLRVYHVEGGKEEEQYNRVGIEHGRGMVAAMEYPDYGFHRIGESNIENVHGFAFLRYESKEGGSWNLHYQGQEAPAYVKNLRVKESWFSSRKIMTEIPAQVVGRVTHSGNRRVNVA
ncbi:hypothetical protein WS78_32205 (plasmid) [Burkholderia savannae]|nr:hypothetical protein WS78_32205 [Burkholderia savannae]